MLFRSVTFGQTPLRIEDVLALANRQAPTRLQDDPDYRERIAKGARFLDSLLDKEGVIYGVTTGYGDSCVVAVPLEHVEALPRHLYTFHGCGLGKLLDAQATRAVLAARLQSLCHGVLWLVSHSPTTQVKSLPFKSRSPSPGSTHPGH